MASAAAWVMEAEKRGSVALLLIDVINAFDFEGSEGIVAAAEAAATPIASLSARARAASVPVIYANDNFGQWRSDFRSTVQACSSKDKPGWRVSERLSPREGDFFVLKPRHSGFYATPLDLLLEQLKVETLVMCGFAANICVLFTANDAKMRGYSVIVPPDCTASNSPQLNQQALEQMQLVCNARLQPSEEVDL
jgi:nicotinamidase-related amidase